jgi:hypothetical protein
MEHVRIGVSTMSSSHSRTWLQLYVEYRSMYLKLVIFEMSVAAICFDRVKMHVISESFCSMKFSSII